MGGCKYWCRGPTPPSIDVQEPYLASAWDLRNIAGSVPDLVGVANGNPLGGSAFVQNYFDSGRQFFRAPISLGNQNVFKTGNFTFSAWILPEANVLSTTGFLSSATAHWYLGATTNGRLLFSTANAAGTQNVMYSPTGAFLQRKMHHVVFTVYNSGLSVRKRIYINGRLSTELLLNDGWYSSYGSSYYLGGYSASITFNGFLSNPKFYTSEMDSDWVIREYHKGYLSGFRFGGFDLSGTQSSGQLRYAPAFVTSGSYHTEPKNDLVCDSDGKVVIPLSFASNSKYQNAYGVWEFDLDKSSTSSGYMALVSLDEEYASSGAHLLTFLADGTLRLTAIGTGVLFESSPGLLTGTGRQRIIVSRRYNGEFSLYLNNVLIPAATGNNPVINTTNSEAKNTVAFCLSGDRIGDFVKRNLPI